MFLPFPHIRIENDCRGRPRIIAEGPAKDALDELGVRDALVAISHEKEYAFATVILQT